MKIHENVFAEIILYTSDSLKKPCQYDIGMNSLVFMSS